MPDWLPDMAVVDPWTTGTYDILYHIFCRDIRDGRLQYIGHPVSIFKDVEDGKEKIFWHLTTRETKKEQIPRRKRKYYPEIRTEVETERLPDLRRCERLPWVKPLVEHPSAPGVLAWDYEEGDGTIKTYVWINNDDFVVIMKKFPNESRRLITSFYVDKPYKREDFQKKYANRIK